MIGILLGTRPEIIKMSPIVNLMEKEDIDYKLIHSGQHYSDNLDSTFFSALELPDPDYNLELNRMKGHHRAGEMIKQVGDLLEDIDVLLVQGDTDTVVTGALAAKKTDTKLGHVEAGLRSGNKEMPEENNRIVCDHISDYLFCPTEGTIEHLKEENITDGVYLTGNTIVEAVQRNIGIAKEKNKSEQDLPDNYAVATIHREENVKDKEVLGDIFEAFGKLNLQIIFPIHPRTRNRIEEYEIDIPENVTLEEPIGYLDFLFLLSESDVVLTDSGGIQEESCILGVPCVTVRTETERPETVEVGANVVAGVEGKGIVSATKKMIGKDGNWENPFGNGDTSEQILKVLRNEDLV